MENPEFHNSHLKIISKYKVFTEFEFESAINCFETDFEELSYALETFKGYQLYSTLIRIKIEYQIRYLEKGEFSRFSHVYKLIMHFLENEISQNSKYANSTQDITILDFEDIFNSRLDAKNILEILYQKEFIKKTPEKLIWHRTGRNSGKEISLFFKYLCENNFIKPDFKNNYKAIAEIFHEKFGLKFTYKTYERAFTDKFNNSTTKFLCLGKPQRTTT